MAKRNNLWIFYGLLLVVMGLWYIYYEMQLPVAILPLAEKEEETQEEGEEI